MTTALFRTRGSHRSTPGDATARTGGTPRHQRIWRRGPLGAFITVVAAEIALAIAIVVGGTFLGTWGLVPVLTGSMRPGIQPGDLVLVTPEPLAAVRAGQVLDFMPPGQGGVSVVHRVVSVTRGKNSPVIRTKGDANNVADSWHARLSGGRAWRVRAVVPKLGYLSVAEHNPLGHLIIELALVAGGVGLALSVLWRRPTGTDDRDRIPAGLAAG